ncbi:extracellular solute-binding protein [Devosia sp.]|jgi:multiple sugar transport system substrate-binding protein|uniref:extracellular solute-binding protein n=1 Tax=Devosia sp. TaxID=1871048 RepID=UPI0037C06779
MTVRLRGITWDHARGYDPLARNAAGFSAAHPGIEVEWSRRSLRDFGVEPVEQLAERFDLLVIDHPFTGRARATGCLVDLRSVFPADMLQQLAAQSVGPSFASYDYGGLWALPTDAASQVASYRPDLLAGFADEPPRSFAAVLDFGRRARKAGKWLAMPSCQSDAACLVATVAANIGAPIRNDTDYLLPKDAFGQVLGHLRQIAELSLPEARHWNPIQTYEAMCATDDIVYVPFGFGYVNYANPGRSVPLRYTTIAGPGPDPTAGAILGGAGCAISARCRNLEAAAAYVRWLHSPEHQSGAYVEAGGQPGHRAAWLDPAVNRASDDFFSATLETLDKAWLRPRFDGFIPAFEHMGFLVHLWFLDEADGAEVIVSSNEAYARAVAKRQKGR